jgi:competence protein ComEC
MEVLAPNQYIAAKGPGGTDRKGRKLTSNSISAVIRICYKGNSIALLPGDIDYVGLENLLEDHPNVKSWLTVYPHHGGRPGGGSEKEFVSGFCKSVQPEVIIFSVRDNTKHFPNKEVVKIVQETLSNVHLYTTQSSEVLVSHIEETKSDFHKDCVGDINLDFERTPPDITFSR